MTEHVLQDVQKTGYSTEVIYSASNHSYDYGDEEGKGIKKPWPQVAQYTQNSDRNVSSWWWYV